MYVCTMPDADLSSLPDMLLMLAAPDARAAGAPASVGTRTRGQAIRGCHPPGPARV
jgi:hypothetical protein